MTGIFSVAQICVHASLCDRVRCYYGAIQWHMHKISKWHSAGLCDIDMLSSWKAVNYQLPLAT